MKTSMNTAVIYPTYLSICEIKAWKKIQVGTRLHDLQLQVAWQLSW